MRRLRNLAPILAIAICLSACGPPATSTPAAGEAALPPDLSASKTLVIAVRSEASSAASKALLTSGSNITPATLFNAGLALIDEQEVPRPFLAESLPQVNTEAWRVFPDGRMETTYTLKPNLDLAGRHAPLGGRLRLCAQRIQGPRAWILQPDSAEHH